MMVDTPLNIIFFAATAVKKAPRFNITKNELIVLTGLNVREGARRGQSVGSMHRYCESHHHAWEYRNFKKLMDGLEQKNYVKRNGIYYSLTTNGIATLVFIDRKLKNLLKEATAKER